MSERDPQPRDEQRDPQPPDEQRDPQPPDGELLSRTRPTPSRQFQDGLRRHLLELEGHERRPAHMWLLVTVYAAAGILLLVIAAVGVGA
jgi:hypothetical protein